MDEPDKFSDIHGMMGFFHWTKTLLKCGGRYIRASGVDDGLIEKGIFGKLTLNQVLEGTHYVRSLYGLLLESAPLLGRPSGSGAKTTISLLTRISSGVPKWLGKLCQTSNTALKSSKNSVSYLHDSQRSSMISLMNVVVSLKCVSILKTFSTLQTASNMQYHLTEKETSPYIWEQLSHLCPSLGRMTV